MSLIDKIPPLVSALAFGYGVGMAAPDDTLASVHSAVVGPQARTATSQSAPLLGPHQRSRLQVGLHGDEADTLASLRGVRENKRGGGEDVSELRGRALQSKLRLQSQEGDDEEFVDDDELDSAETAALSRLQMPDLKLSLSKQTIKYVRYFTRSDRGRDHFETWLKRSGRFQEMIQTELRARNMPEDLIWLAMIESGFDPTARSPAGAVGLWQFMPATGSVYGLRQTRQMDQRKNPKLATQAAVHHLRDLYVRFGDWNLALAAYNMGYEQLLNRIDEYGTADFNELVRQGGLPSETSKYVPKIAAAALVANNLEKFGFENVEINKPWDGAEVPVPPRTSLATLAKAAGVSTSVIKKLNPDLLGDAVPGGKGDYLVLVPPESISRAMAALPAMMQLEGTIHDDDILEQLQLVGAKDPLSRVSNDRVVDDEQSLLSMLPKPKKRRSLRDPLAEGGDDEVADTKEPTKRSSRQTLMYRVGPGDTLIGVARQFAMDVEDVARDNGMGTKEKLKEGSLLKLKVRSELLDDQKSDQARDERPVEKGKPTSSGKQTG
jgi:membrane-bound lytic murein transglycosylase D